MASKTTVGLVCFDLGGVLVRLVRGWDDACQRAEVVLPHTGEAALAKHRDLMRRYETGDIDEAAYLSAAPDLLGDGVTPGAIVKVFDAWLLGLYPGAAELIDDLKARGVKTACLSNTNARHWKLLSERGEYEPLSRLDFRLASHEMRVMKPHEQAFRQAEAATGHWGEKVLFFDDKPENVAAARAVNWKAEVVDRVDDAVPQIREYLAAHGVF